MAIDTANAAYNRMQPDWKRMRDVLAGQTSMQAISADYLRRPMGMTDNTEWERYVKAAPFFEATLRTSEGLTGMAFFQDPAVNAPDGMADFVKDATQDGVPLLQFAEGVFQDVLDVARVGVMVEFPPADPSIKTRRDEEAAKRRPFVRRYCTEDIFNWSTSSVNGAEVLTEVRLREVETERVGEWSFKWRDRIRVLQLVKQADGSWAYQQRIFVGNAWETDDDGPTVTDPAQPDTTLSPPEEPSAAWTEQPLVIPLMDGKPLPYIPFWIINPTDQSPAVKRPPMLGLANANIAHFNTTAALENALFWCGNPQPYIAGIDPDANKNLTIGSSTAWIFADKDIKVGFLQYNADSVTAIEKRLDRLEQHMALLGARMLSPDKAGVEAAETARIHRQGEISVLAGICGSVSRALTDVLRVATDWAGQDSSQVEFKIFTAFFDLVISSLDALNYMKLWQSGLIDIDDLLSLFKKGQIVSSDKTAEMIASNNQSSPIQPVIPNLFGSGQPGGPGGVSPFAPPPPPPPGPPPPAPKPTTKPPAKTKA